MGINVDIYLKVRDGHEPPGNNTSVEGEFVETSGGRAAVSPFATHVVSSLTRYYGFGYERGPWPQIAALLMECLMDPGVDEVWYCGDNDDPSEVDPFTIEKLNEITAHYVKYGHEPYRSAFR